LADTRSPVARRSAIADISAVVLRVRFTTDSSASASARRSVVTSASSAARSSAARRRRPRSSSISSRSNTLEGAEVAPPPAASRVSNRRERKLDQRVAEPRRHLRPGHRHVQGRGLAALLDQTRIDPQPVDGALELDDAHADERRDTEHLDVREVRRHRAVQVVIADPLAAPIDVRGRDDHAAAVDQQLAQRSERARAARQLLRLGDDDDVEPIVDLDAGVAVDADDARAQRPQILGTLFVRRASSDDGADLEHTPPGEQRFEVRVQRQTAPDQVIYAVFRHFPGQTTCICASRPL
jgi:hypothetical protein